MTDAARDSLFPGTLNRRVALGRAAEALEILYYTKELPSGALSDLRATAHLLRPDSGEMEDRAALMLTATQSLDSSQSEIRIRLEEVAEELLRIADGDHEDLEQVKRTADVLDKLHDSIVDATHEPSDVVHMS